MGFREASGKSLDSITDVLLLSCSKVQSSSLVLMCVKRFTEKDPAKIQTVAFVSSKYCPFATYTVQRLNSILIVHQHIIFPPSSLGFLKCFPLPRHQSINRQNVS